MKKKKFMLYFTIVFILMTVIGFALLTGSEADNQLNINGIPQRMEVMQGVTSNNDSPLVKLPVKWNKSLIIYSDALNSS
ncbi:MAG TPA: hypothetical protein PLT91_07830 [Clostridia bacterium]|nr:hypothetical protein [Clostridia bacterium]HQM40124.1 hypothetical protein [Clostridia bacterium]